MKNKNIILSEYIYASDCLGKNCKTMLKNNISEFNWFLDFLLIRETYEYEF